MLPQTRNEETGDMATLEWIKNLLPTVNNNRLNNFAVAKGKKKPNSPDTFRIIRPPQLVQISE